MRFVLAGAVIALTAVSAVAQTTPANQDAHTPAVASSNTVNPGAPVAGKNSFTESQAKSRIEKAGYTDVSGLMKDKDGVWRGKASKSGTAMAVSVDFQGNVTAN
jgi:hypothetical protein